MTQPLPSSTFQRTYPEVVQKIQKIQEGAQYSEFSIGDQKIVNFHLSGRLTLADFRATEGTPLCKKLIDHLQLQESIDTINRFFPFFERLNKISGEILDMVSLFSLQSVKQGFEKSHVATALMEDEEIVRIPVGGLEGRDMRILSARLDRLEQQGSPLLDGPFTISLKKEKLLELPVAHLRFLDVAMQTFAEELPPESLALLSDRQIAKLDFSRLSDMQIFYALRSNFHNEKKIQRRLLKLSSAQLAVVCHKLPSALKHFPVSHFERLPISELTRELLKDMFCSCLLPEERKQRIAQLLPQTINTLLDKLDSDFLAQLSDEQIRELDHSKLSKEQVEAIFERGIFSEEGRRIALVPPQALNALLPKLNLGYLMHLTREQILALDCDRLSKEQIDRIFFLGAIGKRNVTCLPITFIHKLVNRGFFAILERISHEQLAQLSMQAIPQEGIDQLFPPLDPARFHPGYTYSFHPACWYRGETHEYRLENEEGRGNVTYNDEVMKGMMESRRAIWQERLSVLSPAQLDIVRGKVNASELQSVRQDHPAA